jgi:hypothetical protein
VVEFPTVSAGFLLSVDLLVMMRSFTMALAIWLAGTWALPVCCLSRNDRPTHQGARHGAVANVEHHQLHQHHQHHQLPNDATGSYAHVSATGSCSQNCGIATRDVMVAPVARQASAGSNDIASSVDRAVVRIGLRKLACSAVATGPPGCDVASQGIIPLRI